MNQNDSQVQARQYQTTIDSSPFQPETFSLGGGLLADASIKTNHFGGSADKTPDNSLEATLFQKMSLQQKLENEDELLRDRRAAEVS